MMSPEVAIVGAGPAGSALALLLARAGVDVLLLDRAAFPRPKPCGDCLSAEATRVLDRLGVLDRVLAHDPARLSGWRIVSPAGDMFEARFDEIDSDPRVHTALAMPRSLLDAALLDAARAAGVLVQEGATVTDIALGDTPRLRMRGCTARELKPAIVIGADGLRSIVARRAGAVRRLPRMRKLSLTAHVHDVELAGTTGEMHTAPDLCCGLAPVGRDAFNLTIVADADRHGRSVARDAFGFFRAALRAFPQLPARLARASCEGVPLLAEAPPTRSPRLLASGPFDVPVRRVAGSGWALVGDAAGYFDPFTGQGIHQALRGAELLAPLVVRALQRGPGAHVLEEWMRVHGAMTRSTGRVQRLIESVLRRPRLADAAIRRLSDAPRAARALLAVTSDLQTPASLLSPGVLFSFALPASRRPAS